MTKFNRVCILIERVDSYHLMTQPVDSIESKYTSHESSKQDNNLGNHEQAKIGIDSLSKQERIKSLISSAKESMKNEKYDEAVNNYADALSLLNEDESDPFRLYLAPIYYSYGISLLNNSMKQNLLLGDKVPETVQTNSFHDQELETHKMIQLNENDIVNLDQPYVPTLDDVRAESELEKELNNYDDLQLAWEVLDMARIVYTKQPSDKENDLHLAEVHIALGDVGMESELFDTSAIDYKNALSLKSQWMDKDDRALAELHYKIACAYELEINYSSAIEHVNYCLNMLQGREQWIEKQISTQSNESTKKQMSDELDDLNALFPDLKAKLDDLESLQALERDKVPVHTDQGSSSVNVDDSKPALDVSGLIRKKPKNKRDSSTTSETQEFKENCNSDVNADDSNTKKIKIPKL